jgi:hypothetical protein
MHSYSLDTDARRAAYKYVMFVAIAIAGAAASLGAKLHIPPSWLGSLSAGSLFGMLHLVLDKWAWRYLTVLHGVPDLGGLWSIHGQSSFKPEGSSTYAEFEGEMTIRQSFSRIHFCAEFGQSISKSTLAGFELNGAVTCFRYAFENTPKNLADPTLQRHPGLATATIKDLNTIEVEYFSGKHRLRYGMMTLTRRK